MITPVNVTTVAQVVSAGRRRRWLHLANRSDSTIFVKYDGGQTALTADNGIPIGPGAVLMLGNNGADQDFWHDVSAIHAGAGNKSLVIHEA